MKYKNNKVQSCNIGPCFTRPILLNSFYNFVVIYLSELAKTCPPGFRLDSEARIQAEPATLNLGRASSRPGWAHTPGTGLSAGGLLAASRGEGRVSCTDTPN